MTKTKAENEVAFIKQAIEESRTMLVENGLRFILAGSIALASTFLTYGAVILKLDFFIPWIWAVFAGFIVAQALIALLKRRKRTVKTFAGEVYGIVWVGTLIFMAIAIAYIFVTGTYSLKLLLAITVAVLGMAYFIAAAILRRRWMLGLSFLWWAGGFLIASVGNFHAPLVMAGLIIACELVPGIRLFAQSKKQKYPGGAPQED
jgi:hypothetical protein